MKMCIHILICVCIFLHSHTCVSTWTHAIVHMLYISTYVYNIHEYDYYYSFQAPTSSTVGSPARGWQQTKFMRYGTAPAAAFPDKANAQRVLSSSPSSKSSSRLSSWP